MAVNFFGALYCTKAAISSLIARNGTIVVISSHAGYSPLFGRTAYSCSSKHALHGLFESMRTEIKPLGVHVVMVCPGFKRRISRPGHLMEREAGLLHPRSQVGVDDTPEHVAEAVFQGVLRRKRLLILTPVGKVTYWWQPHGPWTFMRQSWRRN